jgi:CMP-N-acetylneuraminic acid synthetase
MPKNLNEYIAIIPARSGSTGIKNKNTKKINRHPLIAHTIEAAKQSKNIKKVFVSTHGKEIDIKLKSSFK